MSETLTRSSSSLSPRRGSPKIFVFVNKASKEDCDRAKAILISSGGEVGEIKCDSRPWIQSLLNEATGGKTTCPQVFLHDEYLGDLGSVEECHDLKERIQALETIKQTPKLQEVFLTQNDYFEFSPKQLIFPQDGGTIVYKLRVRNKSDRFALWRMRLKKINEFTVKPSTGVIDPCETSEIEITLLVPTPTSDVMRFEVVLISKEIPDEYRQASQITAIFSKQDPKTVTKVDLKINVAPQLPSNLKAIRFNDKTVIEEIVQQTKDIVLSAPIQNKIEVVAKSPCSPTTTELPASQPSNIASSPDTGLKSVPEQQAPEPTPVLPTTIVERTPEIGINPTPEEQPEKHLDTQADVAQLASPSPVLPAPQPLVDVVEKAEYNRVKQELSDVRAKFEEMSRCADEMTAEHYRVNRELKEKSGEIISVKQQNNELQFKLKDIEKRFREAEAAKQTIVEKPVYIEKIVEKIVEKPVFVEKNVGSPSPIQPPQVVENVVSGGSSERELQLLQEVDELRAKLNTTASQFEQQTTLLNKKQLEYDTLLKEFNTLDLSSKEELSKFKEQVNNTARFVDELQQQLREKSEHILRKQKETRRGSEQPTTTPSPLLDSKDVCATALDPFMLLGYATIICLLMVNVVFG